MRGVPPPIDARSLVWNGEVHFRSAHSCGRTLCAEMFCCPQSVRSHLRTPNEQAHTRLRHTQLSVLESTLLWRDGSSSPVSPLFGFGNAHSVHLLPCGSGDARRATRPPSRAASPPKITMCGTVGKGKEEVTVEMEPQRGCAGMYTRSTTAPKRTERGERGKHTFVHSERIGVSLSHPHHPYPVCLTRSCTTSTYPSRPSWWVQAWHGRGWRWLGPMGDQRKRRARQGLWWGRMRGRGWLWLVRRQEQGWGTGGGLCESPTPPAMGRNAELTMGRGQVRVREQGRVRQEMRRRGVRWRGAAEWPAGQLC